MACSDPEFILYIGYTGRRLIDEDLRFLTARGACKFDDNGEIIPGMEKKKNRPALLWPDGKTIKIGAARGPVLKFSSFCVYTNALKVRADVACFPCPLAICRNRKHMIVPDCAGECDAH